MAANSERVLSVQSHVVHGYVGNKCATFPLQVLGFEVDAINSVQFSNHTGYAHCKGQVLDSENLQDLIDGLRQNSLLKYSHILTGYIGSESFLHQVRDVVQEIKRSNPSTLFVCDPVLGDAGKLYVPEELLPVYKNEVIPLADIITPNQFEAELLSGVKIHSEEDAAKTLPTLWKDWERDYHEAEAIGVLLSAGAKTVIITSIEVEEGTLTLLGGTQDGNSVHLQFPKLPGQFTGTGDLFTALLLAWMNQGLQVACERTIGTMQAVLKRTTDTAKARCNGGPVTVEHLELQLIASKRDIENPPTVPSPATAH